MAIYHCSIKPVSRGAGRSAPAAAAYRAGERLADERTGEVHNYTRKQGVEYTELILPDRVNLDREQLWNSAEKAEKRKDARVAREFELALPAELTPAERRKLATDFAKNLVDRYGVAADVAVHEPSRNGDQRNHHAHILITTRQVTAQGMGEKTDLEREDKALRAMKKPSGREQIEALRADWATRCNMALKRAGHQERVSHKSLEEQGIEREPTHHLGPTATAMERRGERSERGDLNRGQGEDRAAQELALAEKIQSGTERIRAQAREWRIAQEQARQKAFAAERAKQQERERQEQEARERQARLEAEQKEQERQRRELERAEKNRSRGLSLGR